MSVGRFPQALGVERAENSLSGLVLYIPPNTICLCSVRCVDLLYTITTSIRVGADVMAQRRPHLFFRYNRHKVMIVDHIRGRLRYRVLAPLVLPTCTYLTLLIGGLADCTGLTAKLP